MGLLEGTKERKTMKEEEDNWNWNWKKEKHRERMK